MRGSRRPVARMNASSARAMSAAAKTDSNRPVQDARTMLFIAKVLPGQKCFVRVSSSRMFCAGYFLVTNGTDGDAIGRRAGHSRLEKFRETRLCARRGKIYPDPDSGHTYRNVCPVIWYVLYC